ncbi:MAG: hypothetical protein V4699_03825 [Patescibacteria group bacterium]
MNNEISTPKNKSLVNVFFLILFITFVLSLASLFICDFSWSSNDICEAPFISFIVLIPGFLFRMSSLFLPDGVTVLGGIIFYLLFAFIIAKLYINRHEISKKWSRKFTIPVMLVLFYFLWIPAVNVPAQIERSGLVNVVVMKEEEDTSGRFPKYFKSTSIDHTKALSYSFVWPTTAFLTSISMDESISRISVDDVKKGPISGNTPSRQFLMTWVIQSIIFIIISAFIIDYIFFRRSQRIDFKS